MMVAILPMYVDFFILMALMVGVVGAFRAVGVGNRVGAVSILIVTLLGMYAIAYVYHTYYSISTPIVNSVLAFGKYGILAILLIIIIVLILMYLPQRGTQVWS